jgi:hypothetical protein
MNKILLGSLGAILAVVGLSSYKQKATYYFKVQSGICIIKGAHIHLDNVQGTPLSTSVSSTVALSPTAWGLVMCAGVGNICIVTVSSSNIITTSLGKRFLKTKNIAGHATTVAYSSTYSTLSC